MTVEANEYEEQSEIPMGIRERLAWLVRGDSGECHFCGEGIPEDTEPIRMIWKTNPVHLLVPKVGKLCSPECLMCHMEVAFDMPGLAGDLFGHVEEEDHGE